MADPCTTFADCQEYSSALTEHFVDQTNQLAAQYAAGQIDISDFQITMREQLRQMNALQVVVGAGGQADQVHPNDWLRLGAELQMQDRYLENFSHDIANKQMSEAAIAQRAALYARSTQASFYREASPVDLPNVPGDGGTACLGNCSCTLRFEYEYDEGGNPTAVNVYWDLDPNKPEVHCGDCPAIAAAWNPLRIEVG